MTYRPVDRKRTRISKVIDNTFHKRAPSSETITNKITQITDNKTRIFCILAYLTGGRVSEIGRYTTPKKIKKAMRNENNEIIKIDGVTQYMKTYNPKYVASNPYEKGITKSDISCVLMTDVVKELNLDDLTAEHLKKNNLVLRIRLRNEKNKMTHEKIIYSPFDSERILIDYLLDYVKEMKDDQEILPFNRQKLWRGVVDNAPWFYSPHMMRSFRAIILKNEYELDDRDVIKFMGWSDDRQFRNYDNYLLNYGVIRKMMRKTSLVEPKKVGVFGSTLTGDSICA